jgi:hypothetical protein
VSCPEGIDGYRGPNRGCLLGLALCFFSAALVMAGLILWLL